MASTDDLWDLPRIVELSAARVQYPSPRQFVVGPEVVTRREAVEITVRTDGPVPIRALSPVLVVGETVVSQVKGLGDNRLRFYGLDLARLHEGAPIAFGWYGMPTTWKATAFRFRLENPPNVA